MKYYISDIGCAHLLLASEKWRPIEHAGPGDEELVTFSDNGEAMDFVDAARKSGSHRRVVAVAGDEAFATTLAALHNTFSIVHQEPREVDGEELGNLICSILAAGLSEEGRPRIEAEGLANDSDLEGMLAAAITTMLQERYRILER